MFDLNKRHHYFFDEIRKIPRGSGNEEGIAKYLLAFAKKQGLKAREDDLHNVIIYKKASKGREKEDGIILQAHIDMVCEKNNDTVFDFEKDPIAIYEEDGWLKAKGTTLGADDGYGVAYMLAILEDDVLVHPALECIFTAMEEIGLVGAMHLKEEDVSYGRYINLDGGGEVTTTISNSGGQRVTINIKAKKYDYKGKAYKLAIGGLKGGHSGGLIHMNPGNANTLLCEGLSLLADESFRLESINGGLKENAIPREAEAVFISKRNEDEIREIISCFEASLKKRYLESDGEVKVTLSQTACNDAYDQESSKNIISFGTLCPNGFIAPSVAIPGLTLASLNLGVIRSFEDRVAFNFSMRSPVREYIDMLINKLETLASYLDGEVVIGNGYPGWAYEKDSRMRELLREILKERGIELKTQATHGGLECGFFKALRKDLDIVTYGPISKGAHTPEEMLNLESFDRCYEVVRELITRA